MTGDQKQIDTLTSLRFFAAFAIVLYHIPVQYAFLYSGKAFSRLSLGVDFFFLLSGFVLGFTYRGDRPFNAGDYYRRRFARIYPVYLLSMIVWGILVIPLWGAPVAEKWNAAIAHLLLVHAFFAGYAFMFAFNPVAWTISCEAFFYAVFPLLRRGAALATAIGLAAFLYLFTFHAQTLNSFFDGFFGFFPLMVFWKFGLGVVLAQHWRPRPLPFGLATALEFALGAALILLSVVPTGLRAGYLPILYAVFVLLALAVFSCQSGAISRVLMTRPMVLLGESSYALYLWHMMIMGALQPHLISIQSATLRNALAIASIGGIILLSIATFLWFERPMRLWISTGRWRRSSSSP